jgi:hypothetical protein
VRTRTGQATSQTRPRVVSTRTGQNNNNVHERQSQRSLMHEVVAMRR